MKKTIIEKIMERMVIDDQCIEEEFERLAREISKENNDADVSFVLEGFCGKDVSAIDMSKLSLENFRRLTFDSETIFSPEQIAKFHPAELIEQGKNFSNTENLHTQGIDGQGTTIALIDSCFDSSIAEFEGRVVEHIVFEKADDKISFRKYEKKDGDDFHGNTTASLAAGNECGVAPKAKMYLFGIAEGTDWEEAKEAILQYIKDKGIEPDIISMSADKKTSKKSKKILGELKRKGCAFLDSSSFWKKFSWGRLSDNGQVVLDGLMKTISEMEHDESSKVGSIIKNMPKTAILPCTGRTSSHIGNDGRVVNKYNGSLCGASFAIPQIAGLFLLARQKDPSIKYDEFIEIINNPKRLNSEGMMYLDAEKIIEEISERNKTKGEHLSFSQKVAQKLSSNRFLRKLPFVDKFVQKQLNILPEARPEKTANNQREEFITDLSNNGKYLNLSEKMGISEHRKIYYEIGDKDYEIPMFEQYIKYREENGSPIKLQEKENGKYVIAFDEMNPEEKYSILKEVLDKSLTYTAVLTNQINEDEPNIELKKQKTQDLSLLCRTAEIADYVANKLYSEKKIEEANNKLDKKIQEVLEFHQGLSENEKGIEFYD